MSNNEHNNDKNYTPPKMREAAKENSVDLVLEDWKEICEEAYKNLFKFLIEK